MSTVLRTYVETGVNLAWTGGVAAWAIELKHWGRCGQGETEQQALGDLQEQCGYAVGSPVEILERLHGDEQVFARDLQAPKAQEVAVTLPVLGDIRPRTSALVAAASGTSPTQSAGIACRRSRCLPAPGRPTSTRS